MKDIGMKRVLRRPFDETLAALPDALAAEGFSVLTEIDVRATLKKKLDVDFRRYKILGACNPTLAHRALGTDLSLGVMLPCNVAVYEQGPDETVVIAVDPGQTIAASQGPVLKALTDEVHLRLARVLEKL